MIVLFSLPLNEVDFDQSVLYSTLILAILLTGRQKTTQMYIARLLKLSQWQIWRTMSRVRRQQIMKYGLEWGLPITHITKLLNIHRLMKKRTSKYKKLKKEKKKLNRTIEMYRVMPLKTMSRAWGKFNQLDLPVVLRRPLLGLYVWLFDCKLEEAADTELRNYRNLGEFFRRTLKPDVRSVADAQELTSPADGKILHFGAVKDGILEQVKGVNYSIKHFLGPLSWVGNKTEDALTSEEYYKRMKIRPGNQLYHCVIYLAPGDYHRFHSAAKWKAVYRRHFPGELLSVNPGIARWIHGLFVLNERVVYLGEWQHGFFSYTAVGATNVGSIKIYSDEDLETNLHHHPDTRYKPGVYFDKDLRQAPLTMEKGDMFGEFNLGSTIVLVFEAPKNFKFCISNEQKVKFGEPMGSCL